jgi:hypothetical protein
MRWLLNIPGVILAALGILWILQGTGVLRGGMMGGHIQYAFYGLLVLIVGAVCLVLANRRRRAVV